MNYVCVCICIRECGAMLYFLLIYVNVQRYFYFINLNLNNISYRSVNFLYTVGINNKQKLSNKILIL